MFPTFVQALLLTFMKVFVMSTSSVLAALLNGQHQAAACLQGQRKKGSGESGALPPTRYSPVCSTLQGFSSNRGKFALVVGAGDFSHSTENDLDTAITFGNVYRQKLSPLPVSFQEEQRSWVLQKQGVSECPFLVWAICHEALPHVLPAARLHGQAHHRIIEW